MEESLEKFVNRYGFPIVTGSLKGISFIPYFYSHGPENIHLLGYYIAISAVSDLIEGISRAWVKPDSNIPFSSFERHLVYDIPKLLIKAGGVARDSIPEIYTEIKDNLDALWDGFRRR